MHKSLVDFLNHGSTPFIGRESELGRLLEFLTDENRSGLEALLLIGEAGVGKSRLIESAVRRGEGSQQSLLHIRLRPEGSASLAPLIAEAIQRSPSTRLLFNGDSSSSPFSLPVKLTEAIGRIRRLSALRRTSLIIEDIHLLEGERLHEFLYLLDSLRDEPIGLLAVARPIDFPARGILDAYLREELTLAGLNREEVGTLWERLFDREIDPDILEALTEITRGNALALRSAMRGGIRVSLPDRHHPSTQGGELRIDPRTFREIAIRNVHSLAEGMTAELDASLLEGVYRLARLGEIFTQEAASVIIEKADEMIATLIFKGILARSATPAIAVNAPLFARHSTVPPLTFTHTLLHHDLLRNAEPRMSDLIRVIASGAPLLTYLPYTLLIEDWEERKEETGSIGTELLATAFREACEGSRGTNVGTDWERASLLLRGAELLFDAYRSRSGDRQKIERLEAYLLRAQLEMEFRMFNPELQESRALRLYELTGKDERDEEMSRLRLKAIEYRFRTAEEKGNRETARTIAEEGLAFIDACPLLRRSREHLIFLHVIATDANNRNDIGMLSDLERRVGETQTDPDIPDDMKRLIRNRIVPHFFCLYDSAEELAERQKLVREIDREYPPIRKSFEQENLPYYGSKLAFLLHSGALAEVSDLAADVARYARRFALFGSTETALRDKLVAEPALHGFSDELLAEARELTELAYSWKGLPETVVEKCRIRVGRALSLGAILTGDLPSIRRAVEEFGLAEEDLNIGERLIFILWEERYDDLFRFAQSLPLDLRSLIMICFEPPADHDEILRRYIDQFRLLEYHIYATPRYYNALALVERAAAVGNLRVDEELAGSIQRALLHLLHYYAERRLPRCMRPLLERHGGRLAEEDRNGWEETTERIFMELERREEDETLTLSLLDGITFRRGKGKEERVRGPRSRMLVGLLVANRMLRHPIDRTEFFRLASGVADDPERARISTNVAVLRLREVLGKEAIHTGEGLPELNRSLVKVDLLELWKELDQAEEELHRGRLVKVREHLARAVATAAGHIPFPGLYDPLFEGLRDDIESRLRRVLFSTAQRLLESDDYAAAEGLIRPWIERIGEDGEAREFLADVLRRQGREGEAAVSGMQSVASDDEGGMRFEP